MQVELLEWNTSLLVEIEIIDEQHRRLVYFINHLYSSIKEGKGKEAVEFILEQLVDYTKYHFKEEEKLMEMTLYPDLESHRAQHLFFVEKVIQFQKRYPHFMSIELFQFLKDWLITHIMQVDKKMGFFLKEKGLS